MAQNSAIDHDTAVQVVDFFNATTVKIERKAVAKLGKPVNADSERRIVQGVDRMIEDEFGFPMRALFEVV